MRQLKAFWPGPKGMGGQGRLVGDGLDLTFPYLSYSHFLSNSKSTKKNLVNLRSIKQ